MRTLRAVADLFPAARSAGLTDAEVAVSRDRFGQNRLTPLPRASAWKLFLGKFDEPIIQILLAATLLSIGVDLFKTSPAAGGGGLLAVALVLAAARLFRLWGWLPALLFALAVALFATSAALGHPSVEGLAVMVAVALATGVAFLSEYRSDREFETLNAGKDAARVKVVRGGRVGTVPADDVVVGDLVRLETGDEVAADGRVAGGGELALDQSLMTGESEPVRKAARPDDDPGDGPDHPGCLYRGTQVVDGIGEMVVTNVGDDTVLGQIARKLGGHPDPADALATPDEAPVGPTTSRVRQKLTVAKDQTPLQEKLAALAGLISRVGYLAAGAIFLALLARGVFLATDPATGRPEVFLPGTTAESLAVARNLLGYFVYMVIVVVVAVPEGLPMSVTVSLALAMRKMTRANALVRQLVACETIGSATIICTDKTGTLTQNRMRVVRVGIGGEVFDLGEKHFPAPTPPGKLADEFLTADWIAVNAAVNSTAALEERNGKTVVVGNSTEGALLHWLRDAEADHAAYRLAFPPLYRVPFSSEHKTMTTVVSHGDGAVALVKGAPEVVLARCDRMLTADGCLRPLTSEERDTIARQLAAAAGDAMRTLAFAHAGVPSGSAHAPPGDGLIFDGFAAIRDPLRPDVKEALVRCREAGIAVTMITGDNAETARAVARDAGLLDRPETVVLTSDEFEAASDAELADRLPMLRVLARAKPLDKLRLVRLLREQGHVVAMTGDGTNDAPSLRAADVGLAMGITGTEVAKEASQIVLLDDSFGTIVHAVHWGRALYENIQRFIQFQLTINVSALAIAFLGPFLGLRPPFTVLQLLWINVIMDTFAAIALCSEPPRRGLMKVPPKRRDESIVSPAMRAGIAATATFFVAVMMTLLWGMASRGWFAGLETADRATGLTVRQGTVFFTVYVLFQVWNQINCRSLTPDVSGLRGLRRNPFFLAVAGLTVLGQWAIVTFGGTVFGVEPLTAGDWLAIAAATSSVLLFAEAARAVRK